MGALIERFYPIFFGFIGCLISYFIVNTYGVPDSIKDILSAVMNVCGVTVGFLATVKTIILSFNDQYIVKQLKKRGKYKIVLGYFLTSIKWSFALLILSAIGLSLNFKFGHAWQQYFISLWCFVLITSGSTYFRAIEIFSEIISSLD
jgi:quinol-cytochrome oxidoreductase complex cytochrome b subunit